jgi:hypothetical protein
MIWWEIILVWYAAFSVVSLMSYLFKPLPTFDVVEGIMIGASGANLFLATYPQLIRFMEQAVGGQYILVLPILLGICFNFVLTRWRWVAYYPTTWQMGIGLGLAIARGIDRQIWSQLRTHVIGNFVGVTSGVDIINAIIIAGGTLCALAYFMYTREHRGAWGGIARVGRLIMMASLGISWASYICDRQDGNAALLDIVLNLTRKSIGLG